jgi:CheY-like chemotaxis protein
VDHGTTFRIYLPAVAVAVPLDASAAARLQAPDVRGGPAAAGTLLLVDDEERIRASVARILVGLGFDVLTAGDGLEALDVFRAQGARIDLVLMDLTMPRLDGVAAARAIHDLRPDLPIVLVTGFGEIPPDAGLLFAGMLPKPFALDALRGVIRTLLPQFLH